MIKLKNDTHFQCFFNGLTVGEEWKKTPRQKSGAWSENMCNTLTIFDRYPWPKSAWHYWITKPHINCLTAISLPEKKNYKIWNEFWIIIIDFWFSIKIFMDFACIGLLLSNHPICSFVASFFLRSIWIPLFCIWFTQNCIFATSVCFFMFHEMGTSTKLPLNVANDDAAPTTTPTKKPLQKMNTIMISDAIRFMGCVLYAVCYVCTLWTLLERIFSYKHVIREFWQQHQ